MGTQWVKLQSTFFFPMDNWYLYYTTASGKEVIKHTWKLTINKSIPKQQWFFLYPLQNANTLSNAIQFHVLLVTQKANNASCNKNTTHTHNENIICLKCTVIGVQGQRSYNIWYRGYTTRRQCYYGGLNKIGLKRHTPLHAFCSELQNSNFSLCTNYYIAVSAPTTT